MSHLLLYVLGTGEKMSKDVNWIVKQFHGGKIGCRKRCWIYGINLNMHFGWTRNSRQRPLSKSFSTPTSIFFWILQEARDIECKGVVFKPATAKNWAWKVVRFYINQQTAWWTLILEGAIKLKTEAFRICLTQSTLNSADSLWRPRRRTFGSA